MCLCCRYNAFPSAQLASADEWRKVSMLHDMSILRGHPRFGQMGYGRMWRSLTLEAWGLLRAEFGTAVDRYDRRVVAAGFA